MRTSKPLSRLVKASFNPLFADEIISTTIPIIVQRASEITTCSKRPINVSGCTPDSPELFLLVSSEAEDPGLRVAEELPADPCGSGEILTTTPQGCPSNEAGKQGEAFRSPSSLEEDPPKTNFAEKGYEPDFKTYVSVVILREKTRYIYQGVFVHLWLG